MPFLRATIFLPAVLAAVSSYAQVVEEIDEAELPPPIVVEETITLEQAATLALTHSPLLEMYPWDVRAAEARALQASLWPNPEFSFEVEEVRLSEGPEERVNATTIGGGGAVERSRTEGGPAGFREAEFSLRLSQLFLLGGKREKAVAVAIRERDAAAWDYEIARMDVLREVAAAYVEVLAARDRVQEHERILELSEAVESTIDARVEAGSVSPIEGTRSAVQTSTAAVALEQAKRLLQRARVRLSATWGQPVPMFEEVGGDLHFTIALPLLSTLFQRSEANPDIQAWQYELARRESVLELARTNRIPNLSASVSFVTQGFDGRDARAIGVGPGGAFFSRSSLSFDDSRENRFEFELSIPLPIFDRNQGNIREAEALLEKGKYQRRVTLNEVRTALAAQYEDAFAAYEQILRLRETALPLAEEAYESIQIGYREGKFGYLETLDAQRALFDLRLQLLDTYANYHTAVVEIGRLLGEPLWQPNSAPTQTAHKNFGP